MNDMEISVVIPTYNRLSSLKRTLEALRAQTLSADLFEVIIVSDGSTDGTHDYLRNLKTEFRLIVIQQPNAGPAAARNCGVRSANGRIVVFIDDDIVPIPELLEKHLCVFTEKGENIIVLGPMLTPPDGQLSPWVAWEQRMLEKQYRAMQGEQWTPTGRQFYTGNSSVALRWLIKSGGFDPTLKRAEDVELAYRLSAMGLTFVFEPEAIGYHYAERSFRSWNAIPYAYGKNDVIFHQEKGHTWILPIIFSEFLQRNLLVRFLVQICLDRPILSRSAVTILKLIALTCGRLHCCMVADKGFSGIFNLLYYQGVADQMGGRRNFFQQLGRQRNNATV